MNTVITPKNLTAALSALGAKTDEPTRTFIQQRQNPYEQKRGGLGLAAFCQLKVPSASPVFASIDVFSPQSQRSPHQSPIGR